MAVAVAAACPVAAWPPNDKFIITKSEKKQQLKELSCTNCLMNVKIWTIHSDVTNVTFTVTDEYNDDNELIDTTDSYSSKVFSVSLSLSV